MPVILHRPRSYAALLLTCCLVGFAFFFSSYLRVPIVPLYATSLGATAVQVGAINAVFMLMAGLLSIPAGLLSDRVGRRNVLLGGMTLIAISAFILPYTTTPLQLIALYLLFGIGLAAFAPAMMSYVADLAPASHLGRAFGWYTIAVYLAMMLGPAAGGFLDGAFGPRFVFFLSGALALAMVPLTLLVLPAHPGEKPAPASRPALWPALVELADNRRYNLCLLVTLGGCFGFGMFLTFIPLHLHDLGEGAGRIGLVFAIQALTNVLSRLPLGRLSDQIADRGTLVLWGQFGLGLTLAGIGYGNSFLLVAAGAALLGLSMGVGFTALAALVAEVVPLPRRGLALGGYNSCIYLGMMASSATMGTVVHRVGYGGGFLAAGAVTLATTLIFWWEQRRRRTASSRPGVV